MIDKLKAEVILAYHNLLQLGLGKYSRGIISVVSREADIMISKAEKSTVVAKLSEDIPKLQHHIDIFRTISDIRVIVEPYAKYATVFAQISVDIPILGRFHEDYFGTNIPCISSVDELSQTFKERNITYSQTPAVLIHHNGALTWGSNPSEAVENANYLEEAASLAYLSLQIDPGLMPYK